LIPLSRKNVLRPGGSPPVVAAIRLISLIMRSRIHERLVCMCPATSNQYRLKALPAMQTTSQNSMIFGLNPRERNSPDA
jgi:hypothetical protein